MLKVKRYSKKEFEDTMQTHNVTDATVKGTSDYYICINATGWIHGIPYFKEHHLNVLNVYFDDVHKTGLKVIPWFNNDQRVIYAWACSVDQALIIKQFISKIPDNSVVHIYCAKGKSRSKGVEIYINECYNNQVSDASEINSNVYNLLKSV